jgi:hypothetical protein
MKKQLLIAAVAATMTSVAIADISITACGIVRIAQGIWELCLTFPGMLMKQRCNTSYLPITYL